jgi:hypothetical protein
MILKLQVARFLTESSELAKVFKNVIDIAMLSLKT